MIQSMTINLMRFNQITCIVYMRSTLLCSQGALSDTSYFYSKRMDF
uniref:Uncharacterized protein n=1 Tax=Triticum urartu TaxID=4572 RepID=A0A8R7Q0V3_TRIUA